jgi:hypothetical protein
VSSGTAIFSPIAAQPGTSAPQTGAIRATPANVPAPGLFPAKPHFFQICLLTECRPFRNVLSNN